MRFLREHERLRWALRGSVLILSMAGIVTVVLALVGLAPLPRATPVVLALVAILGWVLAAAGPPRTPDGAWRPLSTVSVALVVVGILASLSLAVVAARVAARSLDACSERNQSMTGQTITRSINLLTGTVRCQYERQHETLVEHIPLGERL